MGVVTFIKLVPNQTSPTVSHVVYTSVCHILLYSLVYCIPISFVLTVYVMYINTGCFVLSV